jgi:predicted MFS family arabinose efflux permease
VAALITTGLGMSIQYSAIQVRMLAFSDGKPDLAVGANSYAGGLAIAFGPLFLGYMGDQVGISRANLYLLPFIALTLLSIFFTRNSTRYHIKI